MNRQEPPFQPKKPAPGRAANMRDLENFAIQPNTREEERELYTGFYERLYEYMQKGRLDFHYVAERLSLRERRIRECMLFRLSSGEVMQLFGLKKGFCFVCEGRLHTKDTPEPVCLRCLNAFERVLEERYGSVDVSHHLHRSKFMGEPGELRAIRVDDELPQFTTNGGGAMVHLPQNESGNSQADIDALKEELDRYKKTIAAYEEQTGVRIGLIAPQVVTPEPQQTISYEEIKPPMMSEEGARMSNPRETTHRAEGPAGQATIEPAAIAPEDHEFLALLDLEESQVQAPADVNVADPIMAGEPLRHYGFKRVKKKEA